MSFRYFLFDLDNCLIEIPDIQHYFDNLLVDTLKYFKVKKIPEFEERTKIWSSGKEYIEVLRDWGVNQHQNFWEKLDIMDFELRKPLIKQGKIKPFEDVLPTLEQLVSLNKRLAIISNTPDYIVEYQLKHFDLKRFFKIIIGLGEDQTICKPEPKGINLALDFFFKNRNLYEEKSIVEMKLNAIMIGDSKVDILAAHNAKIKSCLIIRRKLRNNTEIKKWEHPPDYIIEDLKQLTEI